MRVKGFFIAFLSVFVCVCSGFRNMDAPSNHYDAPAVAPDFTLMDIDGKPFQLSSVRGQYVVLDFWGTWCGVCLKETDHLISINKQLKDKFVFIGINCGDKSAKWKHYVDSVGLPGKQLIMDNAKKVQKAYHVKAFPTKMIIDPNGKVLKSYEGADPRFYIQLEELFKD